MTRSLGGFGFFSVLALLLTTACNSNPLIVEITDCPAVGFVRYANALTSFPEGAVPTANNVAYRAVMSNLDVDCKDRGEGIRTQVAFTITAEPGPMAQQQDISMPYFVVIAREGDSLQAKTIYTASVSLSGQDGRGRSRETVEFTIPTNELADTYLYELLIGFELSNTQARYNLES